MSKFGINKVFLIGNLGQDPTVNTYGDDKVKATFSLACNEYRNNEAGIHTEWINVVLWNNLAKIAMNHLSKGDKIHLEGKIQTRSWNDDEGRRFYRTEVFGINLVMLNSRQSSSSQSTQEQDQRYTGVVVQGNADDLPF